jgi:hypothetical protein
MSILTNNKAKKRKNKVFLFFVQCIIIYYYHYLCSNCLLGALASKFLHSELSLMRVQSQCWALCPQDLITSQGFRLLKPSFCGLDFNIWMCWAGHRHSGQSIKQSPRFLCSLFNDNVQNLIDLMLFFFLWLHCQPDIWLSSFFSIQTFPHYHWFNPTFQY